MWPTQRQSSVLQVLGHQLPQSARWWWVKYSLLSKNPQRIHKKALLDMKVYIFFIHIPKLNFLSAWRQRNKGEKKPQLGKKVESKPCKYFQGKRLIIIHSIYHAACFTIGCVCASRYQLESFNLNSLKHQRKVFFLTQSQHLNFTVHTFKFHSDLWRSFDTSCKVIQALLLTKNWAGNAANWQKRKKERRG